MVVKKEKYYRMNKKDSCLKKSYVFIMKKKKKKSSIFDMCFVVSTKEKIFCIIKKNQVHFHLIFYFSLIVLKKSFLHLFNTFYYCIRKKKMAKRIRANKLLEDNDDFEFGKLIGGFLIILILSVVLCIIWLIYSFLTPLSSSPSMAASSKFR